MDDLKLIKKHYGEDMMHLCRELFPTILETPGKLFGILDSNFHRSRLLYQDIKFQQDIFQYYIYKMASIDIFLKESEKTPFELMKEVGYTLHHCRTEEEIQFFKKYYASGEELCTFGGERLNYAHIFFAVKDNVEEIIRENFQNPQREDEYGTSVISIQFTRGFVNTISIKNRYNLSVENPDNTFLNNLENIIPGLTYSFIKAYNLNIFNNENEQLIYLEGFIKANDGKFYKYNYIQNGIYYCANNIIIDSNFNVVSDYLEKEKFLVVDYFIIDLVNKKFYLYDENLRRKYDLSEFDCIEKIDIIRQKETGLKEIKILLKNGRNIVIVIDAYNRIIESLSLNLYDIVKLDDIIEKIEWPDPYVDEGWIIDEKKWRK